MYNTNTIMAIYNKNKEDGVVYRAKATNGNQKLGKAIFNINLPPVLTCSSNMALSGFWSVHFLIYVGHITQDRGFLPLRGEDY